MESKIKHLEMVQAIINRMASNSFVFKGWAVTIITGISAFAAQGSNGKLLLVAFFATLLLWAVDAYYLSLERCYRALYKKIANKDPRSKIDFNMSLKDHDIIGSWLIALRAPVLLGFYGAVALLIVIVVIIIKIG
jgi:hypothetical protein